MEIKNPVRYAMMPLFEKDSNDGLNVMLYIASRCYLLSEKKLYLPDGSFKMLYEVVFPFQKNTNTNEYERTKPKYNSKEECTNSTIAQEIYFDYQSINDKLKQKNDELVFNKIFKLNYDNDFEKKAKKLKDEHSIRVNEFKKLQDKIQFETFDMKVLESLYNNENISEEQNTLILKNLN